MSIRLSKTAVEMYQQCGMKYKLHYIDKWRTKLLDSPLFFGSAIDEALNCLLITKKKTLIGDEVEFLAKNPIILFYDSFKYVKVLDEKVDIRFSELARYSASDIDLDILLDEDLDYILTHNPSKEIDLFKENVVSFIEECQKVRKEKGLLELPEYKLYNLCAWTSLYRKGLMLIDAYEKNIMPEIVEVHDIQKLVHLPNEQGDHITGFIDFTATFKDGVKRVMDNKTSSQRYTQQDILDSQQLSIYTEFESNKQCGFAVLEKKIRKKEPRVRTELVFGEVSDAQVEKHFEAIDSVLKNVKNGVFEKNERSCFLYGKPCPFYDACLKNDFSGLVNTKEKK
jgi:hypothetical protein